MDHEDMPNESDNRVTIIGRTNFRNDRKKFGIKRADRRSHMYIIGQTGTGKSTLVENLLRQDIAHGEGLALLDPHGDLVQQVLAAIPKRRKPDLIYFDVPDRTTPFGFNPLERIPSAERGLTASGLVEVFKKIWADSWGPRLEYILRNAFLALLDYEEATLADVLRLLSDREFRKRVALNISQKQVYEFWMKEYEHYPANFRAEAIAPIQNKVGAFLTNPLLKNILTQPHSSFDLRQVIDDGKILLVNLAKGKIGEDTAALLGALIVSRLGLAALSRADLPESQRRDFYLYLDEFPTFTTASLANMLSELRKYRLNLILAHQYLGQVDPQIREAVLGNVGTIISFRLGLIDAEVMEKHFSPVFSAGDLINLSNFDIYIRLMIDGEVSRAFSAETLPLE
jgi:type IV secretory pathway TraG/TraD family ATPase VirD4